MKFAALATAALLATAAAAPANAVTVDLSATGNWTGQPGYFELLQSFVLPSNATNVALTLTNFTVDDRGIIQLNGSTIDSAGIFANTDGTAGQFNFGQAAPTVAFNFNAQGGRNRVITSGFNIGGSNSFLFIGNDTNTGIFGSVLTTAANASYTINASVSYDLANSAVPEPATWAMMVLGFGAVGGALRSRRRVAVRFV